jgi:hypothetical protein
MSLTKEFMQTEDKKLGQLIQSENNIGIVTSIKAVENDFLIGFATEPGGPEQLIAERENTFLTDEKAATEAIETHRRRGVAAAAHLLAETEQKVTWLLSENRAEQLAEGKEKSPNTGIFVAIGYYCFYQGHPDPPSGTHLPCNTVFRLSPGQMTPKEIEKFLEAKYPSGFETISASSHTLGGRTSERLVGYDVRELGQKQATLIDWEVPELDLSD